MNIDLDPSEMEQIDIFAAANVIYNRTRDLSERVNTEILKPISTWIDDPYFMKQHRVMIDAEDPNWAEYKRKQREWTQQQRQLAAERLRLYHQAIRRKRKMRQAIARLIPRAGLRTAMAIDLNAGACNALAEIVAPFSPPENAKKETVRMFQEARSRPPSSLFPWKIILQNDIQKYRRFGELKSYHKDRKVDQVAKLTHLLQMETDGLLTLRQKDPFGEIQLELADFSSSEEGSFTVKDKQGIDYELIWQDLSDSQRDKVIADLKANTIICLA